MASSAYLYKQAHVNPSGGADAATIAMLNRYGPLFRVPVNTTTGAVIAATVGGTAGVLTASIKNDHFFHFDSTMVTITVQPGTIPPAGGEAINISLTEA